MSKFNQEKINVKGIKERMANIINMGYNLERDLHPIIEFMSWTVKRDSNAAKYLNLLSCLCFAFDEMDEGRINAKLMIQIKMLDLLPKAFQ